MEINGNIILQRYDFLLNELEYLDIGDVISYYWHLNFIIKG